MSSNKFQQACENKHGSIQQQPIVIVAESVEQMLDGAIPIWELLNMTEGEYNTKYAVKSYIRQACELTEKLCDFIKEEVQIIEHLICDSDEVVDATEDEEPPMMNTLCDSDDEEDEEDDEPVPIESKSSLADTAELIAEV
jgi:hypothetical protein